MKFNSPQFENFGTYDGTYSVVTEREHYDSQITATDDETILLNNFFGLENIHIGRVNSDRDQARQRFRLYPSGEHIYLNLVYPKPGKSELRLYLSQRAGFKPESGEIWFLFLSDNDLWIGAMSRIVWEANSQIFTNDDDDFYYQSLLQANDEVVISKLSERHVYKRNRNLAIQQMDAANFQCENDRNHQLFTSNATSKPYLEAHHLVPMSMQKCFSFPLDNYQNIYCLCPNCHRAIHHATPDYKKSIINNLVSSRSAALQMVGNDISNLYNIYAVEDID